MDVVAIITRLINACWSLFKWGITLVIAALVVVGGYIYVQLDNEIRRYAECFLASHYSQYEVHLGDARFESGKGVTLRNLSISEKSADGIRRQLIHVSEMQLVGSFDVKSLASGNSAIDKIVIKRPSLHATRDTNGGWNVAGLFPPPTSGKKPAKVEVLEAVVSISDLTQPGSKPFVIRDVDSTITCVENDETADPEHPARTYLIESKVGGAVANKLELTAHFQTHTGAFDSKLHVEGLEISSALLRTLPGIDTQALHGFEFSGKASMDVSAQRGSGSSAPITWGGTFSVADGRVSVDGLPRQISDVTLQGIASHEKVYVQKAKARYGKAAIALACVREGWHRQAPAAINAQVGNLVLSDSMVEALPEGLQCVWDRFRPAGNINAHVILRYNSHVWTPDVNVTLVDVAFEDREKFPYRLQHGKGSLRFYDLADGQGGRINADLTAEASGRKISINGELAGLKSLSNMSHESAPPTGWFETKGENLPINDRLLTALETRGRAAAIVEQLDPKGQFTFRWSFRRDAPNVEPHTETDLTFHDGQVRYEKFPYPLSHINGQVFERDGNWTFQDLVSRSQSSPREVHCNGSCVDTGQGHLLKLRFRGTSVPLDDTLRLALPEHLQPTWTSLNPSGRVGFTAEVDYLTGTARPAIHLEAQPMDESVSIAPSFYRYRLEKIRGNFDFTDNRVTMTNFQATHGRTSVAASKIVWLPTQLGGWQFDAQGLNVDRLHLLRNYELLLDAPAAIHRLVDQLKPQGSFSIHNGHVRLTKPAADSPRLTSNWNIQLGLQQNSFQAGVELDNVSGMVRLVGQHDGTTGFTAGQCDIESAFWQGMQLTQIRGPLWVDDNECRLGEGAAQRLDQRKIAYSSSRNIVANMYGGKLSLAAHVLLNAPAPHYTLEARLDKADLGRMSTEYFGGTANLTGSLDGELKLSGMGQSLDLLNGGGTLKVRNATMGELPQMVRLLKVLRNRVPDKTAFNGVDANFRIVGKDIQFEQLNVIGDAISLKGKGTANFDRKLDLVFYTFVGRHEVNIPVLRSMLGQASANLLQIAVKGPASDPDIRTEPLPAVSSVLELLNEKGESPTPPAASGSWWR